MRILVLSDLHLEFGAPLAVPGDVAFDVVVLAGDIHSPGRQAVRWARRADTFGGRPVVLVPGNHEYYGGELETELRAMREAAQGSNVHVLSRDSVVIEGVRFAGCTLWTDFRLPVQVDGGTAGWRAHADVERALEEANRRLRDFEVIDVDVAERNGQRREQARRRPLRAEDTLARHWVERDWLRRDRQARPPGPAVVVTHHAPCARSVAARYAADWVTPAFVSELPDELFDGVALWVHGHTHTAFDYVHEGCRVVGNPRGYPLADGAFENPAFDGCFVVDLAT